MKKLIDNFAVVLVLALFLLVIVLVVKYNTISEEVNDPFIQVTEEIPEYSGHKKEKDYLSTLEAYNDVDIKVDPTKEVHKNTIKITSEMAEDELGDALKTDEKQNYLKSLEGYSDTKQNSSTKTEKLEDVQPEKVKNNDTIGDELDSILGE